MSTTPLPVHDPNHPQRLPGDVRAMACAMQAELVQLRTTAARRDPSREDMKGINVVSPGAIKACRDVLTPHDELRAMSDEALLVRLHFMWGAYCLMCWAHETGFAEPGINFALLPPDVPLRCDSAMRAKEAEVHALTWKLSFELRRRRDASLRDDPQRELLEGLARRIPDDVFSFNGSTVGDAQLLLAECQHRGMLAALRWLLRPQVAWGDAALTFVADLPF